VPKESLRKDLKRLHAELRAADEIDPDLAALLDEVVSDIEQLLADQTPRPESLNEKIAAAAVTFEAEHPRLARVLEDLTDTLAKLGL
jgi:hypothetical protein